MRSVLFCTVLVIAEVCVCTAITSFKSFQLQYNKVYQSDAELTLRQQIFNSTQKIINEHNKLYDQGLTSYRMGINKYSDMTQEEFSSMLKTVPLSNVSLKQDANAGSNEFDETKIPETIDWRTKHVVTPVKNQGNCGSCWAFSATGTLEAHLAINEGILVSLSEQKLLNCDKNNNGCDGGVVQYAYEYIMKNGLIYEDACPYAGVQQTCREKGNSKSVTLKSYKSVQRYNETKLKSVVGVIGPASVAINANFLKNYEFGIFDGYCTEDINHAVLAVGYGTDGGKNYWIIKNSWGLDWGEEGYFKLEMGRGLCGIAKQACYPIGTTSGSSKRHYFNVSVASLISIIIYVILNR